MKTKKRIRAVVSALLVLAMLATSLVLIPTAGAAEPKVEVWDGVTYDYSWYRSGAGTKGNPYKIASGAQLAAWSSLTNAAYEPRQIGETGEAEHKVFNNAYFVLTADIDMGGHAMTPIVAGFLDANNMWHDEYGSGLHFDGKNHTICNLKIDSTSAAYTVNGKNASSMMTQTYALFATVGVNTTVQNLHIKGAQISSMQSGWRVAAVLIGNAPADGLHLENITVDASSVIEGYRIVGGLVGYVIDRDTDKSAPIATVKNCSVGAKIVSTGVRVGGLVGCFIAANAVYNVENCIFYGEFDFIAPAITDIYTGGILGISMDTAGTIYMKNCVNVGVFRTYADQSYAKTFYIAGMSASGNRKDVHHLTNCYDLGRLNMVDVIGEVYRYGMVYDRGTGSTYTYCYSTGADIVDSSFLVSSKIAEIVIDDAGTRSTIETETDRIWQTLHNLHGWLGGCEKTCTRCGYERADSVLSHTYDSACDPTCNVCKAERLIDERAHVYVNDCDVDCNRCGTTRTVEHRYEYSCDANCRICGAPRTDAVMAHQYPSDCHDVCIRCGDKTRVAPHRYISECDQYCDLCGEECFSAEEHTWDNACDRMCNECGEMRTVSHVYTADCDPICDVCNDLRVPEWSHLWGDENATVCAACGTPLVPIRPDPSNPDETTEADTRLPYETVKPPKQGNDEWEDEVAVDMPDVVVDLPNVSIKGCQGSLTGGAMLLAAVASVGFALLGRKKDEE